MTEGKDGSPRCVADCKAVLGEGPVWVARDQALYWVDIKGSKIFRRDWASGEVRHWDTPFWVCSLAPKQSGGFIAGAKHGFAEIDLEANRFDIIANPEPDRATNRFNDGKVDRVGRFWAGTMDNGEKGATGAVYRLDPDRRWTRVQDGYHIPNGPAFSADKRLMYLTDSATRTIYLFDLDADGTPSNKRLFIRFEAEHGHPDGMTVDAEGCLWAAFWGGSCVRRLSPGGEIVQRIEVPVEQPSSCAFGGPDLDHLFVTSARTGLDESALAMQPYAGGLFMLKPGVGGVAEKPFAG